MGEGIMTTTETSGQQGSQRENPSEEPVRHSYSLIKSDIKSLVKSGARTYQIAVRTGDVASAGTDADVSLWVDGTRGSTGWVFLDNSDDNFERGATDYFYIESADIGVPVSAWIYFVPRGVASGWFLDTVTFDGKVFTYYNWLTSTGTYTLKST
jgi:PLAT/LH2 domain-containing protein